MAKQRRHFFILNEKKGNIKLFIWFCGVKTGINRDNVLTSFSGKISMELEWFLVSFG